MNGFLSVRSCVLTSNMLCPDCIGHAMNLLAGIVVTGHQTIHNLFWENPQTIHCIASFHTSVGSFTLVLMSSSRSMIGLLFVMYPFQSGGEYHHGLHCKRVFDKSKLLEIRNDLFHWVPACQRTINAPFAPVITASLLWPT